MHQPDPILPWTCPVCCHGPTYVQSA